MNAIKKAGVVMGTVVKTLAQWFEENPGVAAEWDVASNAYLAPETDGYTANKKAWWICPAGHRYDMMLQSRTLNGQGCPYCKGKRVLAGFNDLATTHPHVLTKWDFEKNTEFTPQQLTASSHKEVWWKCEKGHSWQVRVQSITGLKSGSTGCPYCSGKAFLSGFNDLATMRPDVAAEWNYEKNEDLTPRFIKYTSREEKVWWKCAEGHEWQTTVYARTKKNGTNCPICSRKKK